MAGFGRIPVFVLANARAKGSGGNELSDVVAFIGFVVELAQDRGRPMEGLIVVKKGAVKDDLEQGGVDREGVDEAFGLSNGMRNKISQIPSSISEWSLSCHGSGSVVGGWRGVILSLYQH